MSFPLCNSYWMMVIVASMYGFFTSFVILRTIVLVDLLGLDKLTSAFGLLALFEGSGEFNVLGISSSEYWMYLLIFLVFLPLKIEEKALLVKTNIQHLNFFIIKWANEIAKGAFIYDVRCFPAFLIYLPTLIRYFTAYVYLVKSDEAWPTYLPKNLTSYMNTPKARQSIPGRL